METTTTATTTPVQRYDLGLGKNSPVHCHTTTPNELVDGAASSSLPAAVVSEATQFLVEHEAVIDRARYAPQLLLPQAESERRKAAAAATRPVPLTGSRITDDSVLRIRPATTTNAAGAAVLSATTSAAQAVGSKLVGYDLNTAWVELLIHSEQQRAAAAAVAGA